MASRLIALGVRNGDSLYLEREGRSALVDGGENQRIFADYSRILLERDMSTT